MIRNDEPCLRIYESSKRSEDAILKMKQGVKEEPLPIDLLLKSRKDH